MFKCWQHELVFATEDQFRWHQQNECDPMLKTRNACLFQNSDGKCCRAFFAHTSSLICHYLVAHRQFACSRCYGAFNSIIDLENHLHRDGIDYREKPVRCNACRFSFSNSESLSRHYAAAHLRKVRNEMRYTEFCHLCDRQYTTRYNLNRHLRDFHKANSLPRKGLATTHIDPTFLLVESNDDDDLSTANVSPSPSHDYTVSHLTENEPGKFQIRIEKASKPSQGLDSDILVATTTEPSNSTTTPIETYESVMKTVFGPY